MSIKTVYLICHAHYNVGGRENPTVSMILQRRLLDKALSLVEDTRSNDEGARFKWTCEVSAPVLDFIDKSDKLHQKAFLTYAAAKSLEVTGFAYNYDTMLDSEECERNLDMLRPEIWKALDIRTVMQNGVGGVSASSVSRAYDRGVRYLWVGLDKEAPKVRDLPSLFNWKMSASGHVLTWVENGYGTFDEMIAGGEVLSPEKLFSTDANELSLRSLSLRKYLEEYEALLPSSCNVVPVSFTGGYGENAENGFALLPDFVSAWNNAGLQPRLVIATASEAFDALQTNLGLSGISTYSGEWSSFTCHHLMSLPEAVITARRTERTMKALRRIASYDGAFAPETEKEIFENLCLFRENSCCGSSGAVEHKLDALYAAAATADLLYQDQAKLYFNSCGENRFYVYNTSDIPFADYIRIPKTKFTARHQTYVDENTNTVYRMEYDGDEVCLWVELSPKSMRTYHLSDRPYDKVYNGETVRIKTDELGYPVSFRWAKDSLNLPVGGDLITRNVFFGDGRRVSDALNGRLSAEERNKLIVDNTTLTESIYSSVEKTETDHTVIFTQKFSHPSLVSGKRTAIVWKNSSRVSVTFDMERRLSSDPEMMYVKFDFGKEVNTATASLGGQPFEIGRGQLFNGCNDFVAVDGWVALPYEHTVFFTKDSPVLSFGDEHFFEESEDRNHNFMPVYSYVYNSFVPAKYPVDFAGKLSLRYDFIVTQDAENNDAVARLYEGLYLPPMTNNTFKN